MTSDDGRRMCQHCGGAVAWRAAQQRRFLALRPQRDFLLGKVWQAMLQCDISHHPLQAGGGVIHSVLSKVAAQNNYFPTKEFILYVQGSPRFPWSTTFAGSSSRTGTLTPV